MLELDGGCYSDERERHSESGSVREMRDDLIFGLGGGRGAQMEEGVEG